jgi:hypothetical protein
MFNAHVKGRKAMQLLSIMAITIYALNKEQKLPS